MWNKLLIDMGSSVWISWLRQAAIQTLSAIALKIRLEGSSLSRKEIFP